MDIEKVKRWYEWGIWTEAMVRQAVEKGKLTTDNYFYITGNLYE